MSSTDGNRIRPARSEASKNYSAKLQWGRRPRAVPSRTEYVSDGQVMIGTIIVNEGGHSCFSQAGTHIGTFSSLVEARKIVRAVWSASQ